MLSLSPETFLYDPKTSNQHQGHLLTQHSHLHGDHYGRRAITQRACANAQKEQARTWLIICLSLHSEPLPWWGYCTAMALTSATDKHGEACHVS